MRPAPNDVRFMRRALELAGRGRGKVHPNPLVGALLVKKNRILAEGAHLDFGGPHAEVHAVKAAGRAALGADLYVTLEPCAHYGKTPPCANLLKEAGIRRVFLAAKDPNPLVSGKGIRFLKRSGIQVHSGILEEEAKELNRGFYRWHTQKMPYVTVKAAQSLDGKIATSGGESHWITGEPARKFSHTLRSAADAILVGIETVLKDNPRLTARHAAGALQPVKVVLDSRLRTPLKARLFSGKPRVILAVTDKAPHSRFKRYRGKAEILVCPERGGKVDLRWALRALGAKGFLNVLVEGGGEVIGDAFDQNVVNEAYFFIAPLVIGGKNAVPSVAGQGARHLKDARPLRKMTVRPLGKDWVCHGVFDV